ncbi:MAG: alanine racemase [Magnetococcales bacterium]|nr:alanine racemase [Magnetococcales bacterium]
MQTERRDRPTWLEIDLSAIQHNFTVARQAVSPKVKIFPVIKANGYGLGAWPIAQRLMEAGADGFCVALVKEAEPLRRAGVTLPMVLLSGLTPGMEEAVVGLQLQPFVFDRHTLPALNRAVGAGRPLPLFLKINTGMGRLGLAITEVEAAITELQPLTGLQLAGLVSHLSCADEPNHPENDRQRHRLHQVLTETGLTTSFVSLANSAALLSRAETHFSWVRPGIMLYGASPFFPTNTGRTIGLRPVVRWLTRILQLSALSAGESVGYSRTFIAQRPSRIAILPVGYADGYNRLLGNQAQVLVAGHRVPVVGRVSMDMIAIDVTELPQVSVGQLVTLLGSEGEEHIDVEEMAAWRGTIPYEVLCNVGERVPRYYVG